MPKLYFEIDTDKMNGIQVSSMFLALYKAKHASWTNLEFRVNGQLEHVEADWLKHFTSADKSICDTCNGTGVQCFETSGLSEDGNAPILEPCGMCGYGDERGGV